MGKKKQSGSISSVRKIVESLKKTLFGETLAKAISEPIPTTPKMDEKKKASSIPIVHSGSTKNHSKSIADATESHSSKSAEVERIPLSRPLDPYNISKFRRQIESLRQQSEKASTPWIKLGIDFGTSSTKVVWRGDANVFPVRFGADKLNLNSYLYPSIFAIDQRALEIGHEATSRPFQSRISNFKMCLACSAQELGCDLGACRLTKWPIDQFPNLLAGQETTFVVAYYLGHLLSKIKSIVKQELSTQGVRDVTPKWTANLAVPETFLERSDTSATFNRALRIGWLLADVFAKEPRFESRESLYECYLAAVQIADESLVELSDEEFGCSTYPEIGAEVASIVMSRISEPGLYAFVDIGAGTIDASLFNYFRDGGKANRPPYAAEVSTDLGAAQIEIRTGRKSKYRIDELRKIKETYNGMTTTEKEAVQQQYQAIKPVLLELKKETSRFLVSVFRQARDNKDSSIVDQTIRLVVGGGGASIKNLRDAAITAFTRKHSKISPDIVELALPDDFQFPLPASDFHRFAVAYGLSFPIDELPEIVFSKDVKKKAGPKKSDKNRGDIYEK